MLLREMITRQNLQREHEDIAQYNLRKEEEIWQSLGFSCFLLLLQDGQRPDLFQPRYSLQGSPVVVRDFDFILGSRLVTERHAG